MRVYLASTYSGMSNDIRKRFIRTGKPKYILETFFNGEKMCRNALNDVGVNNFLLDSGAFSYMSGAECSKKQLEEYADRYMAFIKDNKITQYFELDVDTIFGLDFVESLRRKTERATGVRCIPV